MRTLEVAPLSAWSWSLRVTADGRELARLELARLRDNASFQLAGIPYTLTRTGVFRGLYSLEERGRTIARAQRRGFIRPSFQVATGDREITLRQRGFFGSTFAVEHNRSHLGTIRRTGLLTRRAQASLDDRIPLPCQVFLIFLAQVQWRAQARRAA